MVPQTSIFWSRSLSCHIWIPVAYAKWAELAWALDAKVYANDQI
jgi:hypothetical protein